MQRHSILQVPFHALKQNEALDILISFLNTSENHLVVTPNPEAVMLSRRNSEFLYILQNADLVLADGIGILIAAKILKLPISARVPGCDIALALLNKTKGVSVFLLGAKPGAAKKAAGIFLSEGINIVGARDGYFDKETEVEIIREIQTIKPDILIVGMGMPRQEVWAKSHFDILPCKITMCLGGSIDIFAGEVIRAPKIMRRFGMEWFYRLVTNPWRAKRMLDLPRFIKEVIKERICR